MYSNIWKVMRILYDSARDGRMRIEMPIKGIRIWWTCMSFILLLKLFSCICYFVLVFRFSFTPDVPHRTMKKKKLLQRFSIANWFLFHLHFLVRFSWNILFKSMNYSFDSGEIFVLARGQSLLNRVCGMNDFQYIISFALTSKHNVCILKIETIN